MTTRSHDLTAGQRIRTGQLFEPIDFWQRPYKNAAVAIKIPSSVAEIELSGWAREYIAQIRSAEALAESIYLLIAQGEYDSERSLRFRKKWQALSPTFNEMICKVGGEDRSHTFWFGAPKEVLTHLVTTEDLDLLVTERSQISELGTWTGVRISRGHRPFDVLFKPSIERYRDLNDSASRRPYSLASIGGTFNALHIGHCAYLRLAFTLADRVHIYLANDRYAMARKNYSPRTYDNRRKRLRSLLESWECLTRADIKPLKDIVQVKRYVERTADLDLVLCDYEYSQWFGEWCDTRGRAGLPEYDIMCKARTAVHSMEVTSGLIASMERTADETVDQGRLL